MTSQQNICTAVKYQFYNVAKAAWVCDKVTHCKGASPALMVEEEPLCLFELFHTKVGT
jgi:hypothetical protein